MIGCGPYTTRSCIHFFSLSKKEYDAWSNHFWIVYNTHSFESHGLQGKGKTKKKKRKNKERGIQAIITTPLHHRWEGFEKLTQEPSMTGILKPDGFRSRRLPSHPSSGQRCTRTPATPTQTLAHQSVT
jgi:hypothetical protein